MTHTSNQAVVADSVRNKQSTGGITMARNATSTKSYFAIDGSYGSAWGLVVVDTQKWTEPMWQMLDSVSDETRPELAEHFVDKKHTQEADINGHVYCTECSLSREELGESNS
jgi:hypothetical protein